MRTAATAGSRGADRARPPGAQIDLSRRAVAEQETTTTAEVGREISREIVGLFKKYVGRGPTYARTYVHDDLVTTMLHDTMTRGEQTLKQEDEEDKVRELRHIFQGAFRDEA